MLGGGAAIGPAWDAVKCSLTFCCTRGDYFDQLEDNLIQLKIEKQQLQARKEQVETRVRNEISREPHLQQADPVKAWTERVQAVQANLDEVIAEGEDENQNKCIRWCFPKRCCAYNGVGNRVRDKLTAVTNLIRDCHFDTVVVPKPPPPADERPTGWIVGLSSKLNEVWAFIESGEQGILGLYGIGGVGKTTLLKEINNDFCRRDHNFDSVILVELSGEGDVRKVQDSVEKKWNMTARADASSSLRNSDRATEINRFLRTKKFILLLDDLWDPWGQAGGPDLSSIGIPIDGNNNRSKIIFTSRSQTVCQRMKADRTIKVEGLEAEEALQLFHHSVGQATLEGHSDIPELSQTVAEKCQGLPLALIIVGKAMVNQTSKMEWNDAIRNLETDPSRIQGMADHVFGSLKFSVDALNDNRWSRDTLKICFVYCSIFAKNHMIRKDELVELWMGEQLLGNSSDVYRARNEGQSVISVLQAASLLESGETYDYVKMHNVVRDFAIWLGENEDNILVQGQRTERWTQAKRISMQGPDTGDGNLMAPCRCPDVKSFIIRNSTLKIITYEFLHAMTALEVLNLSGNRGLTYIPDAIGSLIHLHYLNLSGTGIDKPPPGVGELHNLEIFLVDYTPAFEGFPEGVISCIPILRVFSKLSDHVTYDDTALLLELERMENISDISICIFSDNALRKIAASPRIQSSIRMLSLLSSESIIYGTPSLTPVATLGDMGHLERLLINDCPLLQFSVGDSPCHVQTRNRYFRNLRHVCIWNCPAISNLGWLGSANDLRTLELFNCNQLKEIISRDPAAQDNRTDDIFPNLTDLTLGNLPVLASICWRVLPFPRLQKISVHDCESLKELPFNSNSARNLKEIRGSRIWWDNLQNDQIKEVLGSKFIPA